MRSLETAAQAGVLIVGALAAIIVAEAAAAGFPAVRSGELPLWGLKVSEGCITIVLHHCRLHAAGSCMLQDQSRLLYSLHKF